MDIDNNRGIDQSKGVGTVQNGNFICDAAEEAVSTDSDEYLSGGPLR